MKQWKRVMGVALSTVLALSVIFAPMKSTESDAKAKKAVLKTKKVSVQVGKTKTISLKYKKKSCKYTFKSSKKKIATVSSKGKVKGIKAGTAKITVKEITKKGKGKARKVGTVTVKVTKKKSGSNNVNGTTNDNNTNVTPAPQSPVVDPAVKVYMDEIKDENLVAEVGGVGFAPAATTATESKTPDLSTGLVKKKVGNPIITSRLTADPWAMEYNGRIYVYGTNDSQQYDAVPEKDNNYSKIKTLNCYSSADMVNWTDHGTIAVSGSKGAAKWSSNSWAPAVAHKKIDGKEKFFLYFANNASSIGVLTADSPTGPWTDPIGKALIDRSIKGCEASEVGWLFDPAVLVDDDGSAYLYFGGIGDTAGKTEEFIRNPKCARVVKLGENMISVDGAAKTIDAPFMFEDSGINKIGDKYYYSYCTNWTGSVNGNTIDRSDCPAANIAVMVSDSPMGEFKYVGCIMKNPGTYFKNSTGNNHHCLTEFNGTLYAFYHTKKDTLALGTKQDYRTTYVNTLNLGENGDFTNKDGSVADTKMTTMGVKAIATLNPYDTVEAETFAMSDTVGTVVNTEKNSVQDWYTNYSIYNGKVGSYIGVSNVDFGADGASEVAMKLSDTNSTGYKELTAKLSNKITGQHTIYFVFNKAGVLMDSWSFKK